MKHSKRKATNQAKRNKARAKSINSATIGSSGFRKKKGQSFGKADAAVIGGTKQGGRSKGNA